MKTQTRKEKRKIAFWVSLDAQGIGLIGCNGEGLKLNRGKVRLGAELPTGARLGSPLSLSASCLGTWPPSRSFIWESGLMRFTPVPPPALGTVSALPSCWEFQPRAGGCEGPYSLSCRMGHLAKVGLFPLPALNPLLASRGVERNCVRILWVMGVGGAKRGTLPGLWAKLEPASKDSGWAGRGREMDRCRAQLWDQSGAEERAWEGCRGCWCHIFPSSLLPQHKRPSQCQGVGGAVHGQLTPHYPIERLGLEGQHGGVWPPSSLFPFSPRQAVPLFPFQMSQ